VKVVGVVALSEKNHRCTF